MSAPRSTEHAPPAAIAWLWLLLSLAALGHAGWVLRGHGVVVDLFALLPERGESAWQRDAIERASAAGSAQVVLLLAATDESRLAQAVSAFRDQLAARLPELVEQRADAAALDAALQAYQPQRNVMLSSEQRDRLRARDPDVEAQAALARLLQPVGLGLLPWAQDPLGLAGEWWQARNPLPALQPVGGELRLAHAGQVWSLLRFELRTPAFALGGERRLGAALDEARRVAEQAAGEIELRYAGVPVHADAAAAQAAHEMSTIGLGSLLAVLLLVWLAFASLRPILLVASSLLIGCAVGLSSTVLLFGEVHVLTLVFGASLVGVAEDYGIHYFSARQAQPDTPAWTLLAQLRPSLLLALVTSVLAYLALGALPFPGLRQMAWFSASGLCAAFITVLLWFPRLERGAPRRTALATALCASLQRIPTLRPRAAWALALLLLAACAWLLRPLTVSDDLRQLQGSPPELLAMQIEVGRLLALPSPAQFYLLQADSEAQLLQREEALLDRLAALREQRQIAGWIALSDWVPSPLRQAENRALVEPIEARVRLMAAELLGETTSPVGMDSPPPWTTARFAASPLAALQPGLQFGETADGWYSLVQLRGLQGSAALGALAEAANGLPGTRWVDRTAEYSALLALYRGRMSLLLGLGLLAVAAVLHLRHGRRAWRAWLPTVLAIAISLAALAQLGQPLTLFTVLALLLLLGIGVDYGIFLLDHGDGAAWMAVVLGATSTLLAFGLLGLSATPALRAFGLTLLFGIGAVWLLSPLYRPPRAAAFTH